MTFDEVVDLMAMIRVLWPHSDMGDPRTGALVWQSMLAAADKAEVEAAVRELAQSGREHAPAVGVILKATADRQADAPDWDEVRAEVLRAIGSYRPPRDVAMRDPYAAPPSEYWSHPLVAAFMENAWTEWRMASEGDGTFAAQQREAYKAARVRLERSAGLGMVGAPRGRSELRKPFGELKSAEDGS